MALQDVDEPDIRDECVVGGGVVVDAGGGKVRRSVFASQQPAEVYAGPTDDLPGAQGLFENNLPGAD